MSFVLYVPQAARVSISELVLTPERVIRERHPDDLVCNRIRLYSMEGELFFGAAPELEEHFDDIARTADEGVRVIVLRLKRARNPDAVCMNVLDKFVNRMHNADVEVLLCGVRPDMLKTIQSSGLTHRLGPNHVFAFEETGKFWTSTMDAVRYAYELIGDNVCETCPRHGQTMNEKEGWYYLI